jgi:hypothetical protein
VILTGGIFPLAGKAGINQVSWLSPSRWGYAAVASTANLNVIEQPKGASGAPGGKPSSGKPSSGASGSTSSSASPSARPSSGTASGKARSSAPAQSGTSAPAVATDPLWRHNSATWLKDIGAMLLLGLLFSVIAWQRIIRIRPGRRK